MDISYHVVSSLSKKLWRKNNISHITFFMCFVNPTETVDLIIIVVLTFISAIVFIIFSMDEVSKDSSLSL